MREKIEQLVRKALAEAQAKGPLQDGWYLPQVNFRFPLKTIRSW